MKATLFERGLNIVLRSERSKEIDEIIENEGLDLIRYSPQWKHYHIRLEKGDVEKHKEALINIMKMAYGKMAIEE